MAARTLQPCGTRAAYARHLEHCEPACDECKEYVRVEEADRRKARQHLRDRYPDEFDALYEQDRAGRRGWVNGAVSRVSHALVRSHPDEFATILADLRGGAS